MTGTARPVSWHPCLLVKALKDSASFVKEMWLPTCRHLRVADVATHWVNVGLYIRIEEFKRKKKQSCSFSVLQRFHRASKWPVGCWLSIYHTCWRTGWPSSCCTIWCHRSPSLHRTTPSCRCTRASSWPFPALRGTCRTCVCSWCASSRPCSSTLSTTGTTRCCRCRARWLLPLQILCLPRRPSW